MSTVAIDAKHAYLDTIGASDGRLPGHANAWLRALRERAAARFAAIGFPTPAIENWKYTNVTPVVRQSFEPALSDTNTRPHVLPLTDLDAFRLVFVNGRYDATLSTPPPLPAAGYAGSLAQALTNRPDELELYLGRVAAFDDHGFAALNTAFMLDGAYVRIPAATKIDKPLHLIYFGGASALAQPRTLIVAETNSHATVVEHYLGFDDARYLTNAVTEVVAERGAIVEHYRLQQERLQGNAVTGLYVRQSVSSRFASHAVDFGGALVRNDLHAVLAEGAECALNGLYVVDGRQHVDNHTVIEHAQPRGVSRELYKGVLDGRARAVFNGRVVIRPDAQQIDAQQMNNNLLLSEDAEIDTKPEFEIYADDVKCSHGATVGQLDPDALFYLRSRAIDDHAARDLLTYAFAHDILNRFSLQPIRRSFEKQLVQRLLRGRQIKEVELV
jgi:Fe-S cluster assembly protein SufD